MAIAKRLHPFPSRTRKLSSLAPMVLLGKLSGRVGRRRSFSNPGLTTGRLRVFFIYYCLYWVNLRSGCRNWGIEGFKRLILDPGYWISGQWILRLYSTDIGCWWDERRTSNMEYGILNIAACALYHFSIERAKRYLDRVSSIAYPASINFYTHPTGRYSNVLLPTPGLTFAFNATMW